MKFAATIAAALLLASPVSAGWQGAEWGQSLEDVLRRDGVVEMTEAEVELMSNGQGERPRARGSSLVAGIDSEVVYFFGDAGLTMVAIRIDRAADMGRAEQALEDIYGSPVFESEGDGLCPITTRFWFDRERGNRIEHSLLECSTRTVESIRYTPLATPEGSGL